MNGVGLKNPYVKCYTRKMNELIQTAADMDVHIDDVQASQFSAYLDLILEWNERINLTAITEPHGIKVKHFLDSLTLVPHIPDDAASLADIGSGAGFPGIPLKIACPHLDVTLVESIGKKADFLDEVIQELGLDHIQTLCVRAEDIGQHDSYREQFDIVTARAVAFLPILSEYALPLLKIGGTFLAQKSNKEGETDAATQAIHILGGELVDEIPVTLPELPDRKVVVIKKVLPTPKEYPRIAGVPTKEPL